MNKKFILPDFDNSILNVSATLAEFLGCENKNTTLAILKKELQKNYKNIICICFDGLGIHPIGLNLPQDDFLRKTSNKQSNQHSHQQQLVQPHQ